MARRPQEDPRVTDLRRYRKARDQAKRAPAPKPSQLRGPQGFLGSNPRAGLILAVAVVVMLALWVLPTFL